MSTSRAIQISVMHTALGIAIGSAIEAALPPFNEGASLTNLAFETLVQVGLNGVSLVTVAGYLQSDDPTFGIPFSMALYQSQSALRHRIEHLSAVVKHQALEVAQRTAPAAPAV